MRWRGNRLSQLQPTATIKPGVQTYSNRCRQKPTKRVAANMIKQVHTAGGCKNAQIDADRPLKQVGANMFKQVQTETNKAGGCKHAQTDADRNH